MANPVAGIGVEVGTRLCNPLIWIVRLEGGRGKTIQTDRVEMQLWNDELAREPGMGHCCGLKCALGQAASITQTILEQEMNATKSEEKTDG